MRYIVHPGAVPRSGSAGRQGRGPGGSRWSGVSIPAWFVLTPEAFDAGVGARERRAATSPALDLAPDLALAGLNPRRSCRGAGLALPERRTGGRALLGRRRGRSAALLRRAAGELSLRAAGRGARDGGGGLALRLQRTCPGLPPEHGLPPAAARRGPGPAHGQRERSGVAFSADPVTGRRGVAVVAASMASARPWSPGSRRPTPIGWIGRGASSTGTSPRSDSPIAPPPDGVGRPQRVEVPTQDAHRPALTDDEVRAVAALARQAGRHFGRPQDIEWAIADGSLYLLQSRPITVLSDSRRPGRRPRLWDNSNIAESYSGVTTPLTFSFARRVYEEVYRQFCRSCACRAARDRRPRRHLPPHARPHPRPRLLQPAQLVSRCSPCCRASR